MAKPAGPIPGLDELIGGLAQVNAAAPLLFALVAMVRSIWTAATGHDVDLAQYANLIEAQLNATDAKSRANVDHFRALIDAARD
jgi:hypothetical protein